MNLQTSNLNTKWFGKRFIGFHEPRCEGGMLRISVSETKTHVDDRVNPRMRKRNAELVN